MENDLSYFRRRALQERMAALKAGYPRARQAHFDMAEQYDDLVRDIVASERSSGLRFIRSGLKSFAGHTDTTEEAADTCVARKSAEDGRPNCWPEIRRGAVAEKNGFSTESVARKPIPLHDRGGPVKESFHNPATIDEFDRERMGIAAKE